MSIYLFNIQGVMKVTKFLFASVILPIIFSIFLPGLVLAQYDSDVLEPRYEDGAEVFGISTNEAKTLSFFPQGCKSIDKVEIEFSESVEGEIKVRSNGEESPIEGNSLDKTFEYCTFEWSGISADNISSFKIDAQVRKSWQEAQNVSQDDIAVYSFVGEEWVTNDTNRGSDNAIYHFYNAENIEFSDHFAVAESTGGFDFPINLSPISLLICCIVLLVVAILIAAVYGVSSRNDKDVNVETY